MKKDSYRVLVLSLFIFNGIFLSCTTFVNAQDFLVTIQKDSLNCKIGKLTGDFYPIEFILDDELMNGMIHKDSVLFFKKNMFRSIDDTRLRPWYPRVTYGINIGGGRQFGQLRVGLTEDLNPQWGSSSDRNVFYAGSDLVIYLSALTGYGIKYHYRSMLGGDIQQHYVGPMFSLRFWDNDRKNHWFLQCSAGLGAMSYTDAAVKLGQDKSINIKLTAKTLAGDIAVGYNKKLSRNISSLFKLSLTMGYPDFVRIFDDTRINPSGTDPLPDISGYCQNMNSVNFSVGFEFY